MAEGLTKKEMIYDMVKMAFSDPWGDETGMRMCAKSACEFLNLFCSDRKIRIAYKRFMKDRYNKKRAARIIFKLSK